MTLDKKVVALTGSAHSGKSTIMDYFTRKGAYTFDCDKLGHQIYEPDTPGYHKVVAEFGKDILDDDEKIDRKKLGKKVFTDLSRFRTLSKITWPFIEELLVEKIQKSNDALIVYEAATLVDAGWYSHADFGILVNADERLRVERLMKTKNLDEKEAKQRIVIMNAVLTSDDSKRMVMHGYFKERFFEIESINDFNHTYRQVDEIYRNIVDY